MHDLRQPLPPLRLRLRSRRAEEPGPGHVRRRVDVGAFGGRRGGAGAGEDAIGFGLVEEGDQVGESEDTEGRAGDDVAALGAD